nr:hypothetical protein [Tanacetum cinerariifolium]
PNLSHFNYFRAADEPPMTPKQAAEMLDEHKRLANLKKYNEESEKALDKMNTTQLVAQNKKLQEIRARRKRVMERTRSEYMECMGKRVDNLPITGIKYHIESNKQATMTITEIISL